MIIYKSFNSNSRKGTILPLTLLISVVSVMLILFISSLTDNLSKANDLMHGNIKHTQTEKVEISSLKGISANNNHLYTFLKSNTCAKKTHLQNSEILTIYLNNLIKNENLDDMQEIEINSKKFYKKPFVVESHGLRDEIVIEGCVNEFLNLYKNSNYFDNANIWIMYNDKKIFLSDARPTLKNDVLIESTILKLNSDENKLFKVYLYVE